MVCLEAFLPLYKVFSIFPWGPTRKMERKPAGNEYVKVCRCLQYLYTARHLSETQDGGAHFVPVQTFLRPRIVEYIS